ncbi:hypothetical protein [Aphanothece hegewaldii]|uniref:hypothetical protein n=1 Tax=Aphanothece hegewaldii TaxID=1521625 RepID=UPI001C6325FD|nr:hypothetical protein [Aphanothece hegewaldii]
MFKEFFAILVHIQAPSQLKPVNSVNISAELGIALCSPGIVGIAPLWDLYDMWI